MRSSSWATAALVGLAVVVLGFFIVRDNLAAGAVLGRNPAVALALVPSFATAHTLAAENATQTRDARAVIADATAALTTAPMNAIALRALVVGRAMQRDNRGAGAALRLAAALGWRDTATDLLAMANAANAGDVAVVAQRADALARRGEQRDTVFPTMRALAQRPDGLAALVERLKQSPEWRGAFLADTETLEPADYPAREHLYRELAASLVPPQPHEVAPYVATLVARRQYDRARGVWLRWGGSGGDPALPIQDASFDRIGTGPVGFGWTAGEVIGASVTSDQQFDAGRNVLRVDTNGTAAGAVLSQLLTLAPGSHRFSVETAPGTPAVRDGVRWTLRCADGGAEIAMAAAAERTIGRWRRQDAAFDVPSNCAAQLLELRVRAVDMAGAFSAWFDHAAIR